MGLAAFPDVALRDAAILGLHCCCKEMSNVTKVNGVISDDADVNLAADILTPRMPFANNPPLNSSHRWLLASPFSWCGETESQRLGCPASRHGSFGLRCDVCASVCVQLFVAGQLWQGRGCAEVSLGGCFGTFMVTSAGVAEADPPSSVSKGSGQHRWLSCSCCLVPNGQQP